MAQTPWASRTLQRLTTTPRHTHSTTPQRRADVSEYRGASIRTHTYPQTHAKTLVPTHNTTHNNSSMFLSAGVPASSALHALHPYLNPDPHLHHPPHTTTPRRFRVQGRKPLDPCAVTHAHNTLTVPFVKPLRTHQHPTTVNNSPTFRSTEAPAL